jgi:hypothetical protein
MKMYLIWRSFSGEYSKTCQNMMMFYQELNGQKSIHKMVSCACVCVCVCVAGGVVAITHQKIKIIVWNFGSSFRMIMECAMYKYSQNQAMVFPSNGMMGENLS